MELAIEEYDQAIALDPQYAEAYLARGYTYAIMGDLDRAIADFDQAIALDPQLAEAYAKRGTAYAVKGDFDQAIADLDQAIALDPQNANAYMNRGNVYDDMGDSDRAIADFDQAIALDPQHAGAYANRGTAYAEQGDLDRAIADFDQAIALYPQYAYAYYSRGRARYMKSMISPLSSQEQQQAISDLERAVELGLEPSRKQNAEELLKELRQATFPPVATTQVLGQIDFDGFWQGTTSQGEEIVFLVAENGIAAIQVSFQIPGCESESPVFISYGQPRHFITGNTFSFTEPGLVNLTITGTFSSSTRASGTLEIGCKDGLNATWTASWSDSLATPTPRPEFAARIPDMKIRDDLFFRDAGGSNFDTNSPILYSKGDWFLVRSASTRSMLPIPGGWTTGETGGDTWILFSPDGNVEYPTIQIRLGASGYDGDPKTSQEVITELEESVSGDPNFEILNKEIVDTEKGYVLLVGVTETGRKRYILILYSREPLSEDGGSGGWFHTFSAFIYEEDWDDYYPIIQAMVEYWYGLYDNPLGVALPDTLLE